MQWGDPHAWVATSLTTKGRRNANRTETPGLEQAGVIYHRPRDMNCCCICRLGETDGGGLATARVDGSTIGMALRVRWASGW